MRVRFTFFSGMSVAAAVAASAVVMSPMPADAKKAASGTPVEMSDSFRATLATARSAIRAGDMGAARASVAALTPATDFEVYAAAGARFELATQRRDIQAQRVALSDIFKSSAVPRSDAPRLRYLAALFSYMVGNYDDTLAQLAYARTLGYDDIDATLLSADTYIRKNRPKEARPIVDAALARQRALGQPISAAWYDRAISMAYSSGDWDAVGALYRERLAHYSSAPEWRSALVNTLSTPGVDTQIQLDLYRLQAANGAMASERDYQAYATLAEKAGYSAESKAIIEAGRAAGKLTATQPVTAQLLKNVAPKATKEIAALPAQAKKADAANKGDAALKVADSYFSLAQFPKAAEYYRLALAKGGVKAAHANARLGVALARSGDLAGGSSALAAADGEWANVAGFWSVWVAQQSRKVALRSPVERPIYS
ncbi:hypothetical protein [Sphingobium sp. AN558]|uniref:hypothetical protein n=1 Tax=Sphingobium sp. AN558 TaxID=3133442 RepID=UPI0040409B4E